MKEKRCEGRCLMSCLKKHPLWHPIGTYMAPTGRYYELDARYQLVPLLKNETTEPLPPMVWLYVVLPRYLSAGSVPTHSDPALP